MGWNWAEMRHPSRQELLLHAESLVDGAPVSARAAAHTARCPRCAREVAAMRATMGLVARAVPSAGDAALADRILADHILSQARALRAARPARRQRIAAAGKGLLRATAYAVCSLGVAFVVFGAALGNPEAAASAAAAPAAQPAATASPESLRRAADTVAALSEAVRLPEAAPRSLEDRAKLRTVDALDADIVAARAALERNPGCVRASHIVHANLQRQAQTLRDLYVQRAY